MATPILLAKADIKQGLAYDRLTPFHQINIARLDLTPGMVLYRRPSNDNRELRTPLFRQLKGALQQPQARRNSAR